jgi:AraC family transcriptional regulator, activator of mtrCDE
MDVLSDIFETIRLRGTFYFRTNFSGIWGTTVPRYRNAARFHFLVEGHCYVTLPSETTVVLHPGDLILIPGGQSHMLRHDPEGAAPALETVLQQVGYSGEGVLAVGDGNDTATTKMVCGHLSFDDGADHPLLRALPEYMLITPAIRAQMPWLDETLRLLVRHVFSQQAGAVAAVTRLSEIVFIEAIRGGLDESPTLRRVLGALADQQIGRALQLMHAKPAHPWTVESLAHAVGMSRSRFAERFDELVGCGPIRYLADWRLQRALALLGQSRISMGEIARQLGYSSAAVFTRAFTQKFGQAPSALRAVGGGERRPAGEEVAPRQQMRG